ncbi:MAG: hypothetical protein M5U27_15110 [Gaiella sp.]|nr:hypothetical protein [Gaiella sp.]
MPARPPPRRGSPSCARPTPARRRSGPASRSAASPFGHDHAIPMYVDEDLLVYDEVWAAAGLPDAVFPISPQDLQRASGARAVDLKEE